jgi:MFS family permease
MMLVVYFDRGAVGSAVKALEDAFDISETRAGLVASLFMISFTLSSPIFAHFSSYSPPLKMVAVGMGVWIIAVLGTAFSPVYAVLALVRCLSGIGEASFLCISPVRSRVFFLLFLKKMM